MSRRSLPDPVDEVSVQYGGLSSRALQSAASFGLHNSEEIADMDIAVEFGFFLACQFALATQLRQLVHARDIALAKTNRHQIFGCATRQLFLSHLDDTGENRRLSIGASGLELILVPPSYCAITLQSCHGGPGGE